MSTSEFHVSGSAQDIAARTNAKAAPIPRGYVRHATSGCLIPDSEGLKAMHVVALEDKAARRVAAGPSTDALSLMAAAQELAATNAAAAERATAAAEKALSRIAELEKKLAEKK